MLAKMKAKKEEKSKTSQSDDHEKKITRQIDGPPELIALFKKLDAIRAATGEEDYDLEQSDSSFDAMDW